MFIELHMEGMPFSLNFDKVIRFIANGSKTHVVCDKSTGFEIHHVDEDYDTVKALVDEVIYKYTGLDIETYD